ncbi:hypothetical protein EXIGLDRAFT_574591, partial [Exidia glandulosa HHB12029]
SALTGDRMGILPLVEGMPVMVLKNVLTLGGVVNGAPGTLQKVYYSMAPSGERYAVCALVKIQECLLHYDGLEPGVVPIFPEAKYFSVRFRDQSSKSVTRFQLPLIPGFAYTDYKSQGQGLQYAIIDPASTG